MKDKTHDMNRGFSAEAAEKGYEDAGKPMLRRAYKREQMKDAGLLDDKALQSYENNDGDEPGIDVGGFLPRNNYSDRY